MKQFNADTEFKRERFNIENARIVEQSNLAWRRQVNTVNTAAQNDGRRILQLKTLLNSAVPSGTWPPSSLEEEVHVGIQGSKYLA